MKKVHFFYLAALCLFFSCKKDKSEDTSYHVTCKIDGVAKSFSAATSGIIGTPEAKGIVVIGASTTTATAEGFAFILNEIANENNVSAGTYTDESTKFQLLANYNGSGGSDALDYHAGTEMYKESVMYSTPITDHFKVVVTAIDDKTVRGTFSGDFYLDGDIKGDKISVTEGNFYVQLKLQQLP
jgi:hypothetical protein